MSDIVQEANTALMLAAVEYDASEEWEGLHFACGIQRNVLPSLDLSFHIPVCLSVTNYIYLHLYSPLTVLPGSIHPLQDCVPKLDPRLHQQGLPVLHHVP